MSTVLSLAFVVLSVIGIADAGYITYESAQGLVPACGAGFDCGGVLTSEYAHIGPIPLSLLGLVFYSVVFLLATLHLLEVRLGKLTAPLATRLPHRYQRALALLTPRELLTVLTTLGFAFSLYLVFLMGVVIQAWCLYCLISAGTSLSLFAVSQLYQRAHPISHALLRQLWLDLVGILYRAIAKPLFFLLDPEVAHDTLTRAGELLGGNPLTRTLTRLKLGFQSPVLSVQKDGITFPNTVGLAAGFDYNGRLTGILPSVGFGFHTIGTVTWQPYAGNPRPRLGRFPHSKGLLVNKGLKTIGTRALIRHLRKQQFMVPTGISIGATNKLFRSESEQILDILQSFIAFERSGLKHAYYELNISCPNTFGGEPFTTPHRLRVLLILLDRLELTRPVYIKMPIDDPDAALELLEVAQKHQIAGVVLGNLTKDKRNPSLTPADAAIWNTRGGNVSGRPTWERSNTLIKRIKARFQDRFTIIGTGGIFSAADAAHKQALGADLVQLITGMIYEGPQLIGQITLDQYYRSTCSIQAPKK